MKKIFVVLLCVFPLFVFADSLSENKKMIDEFKRLHKEIINEKQYAAKMTECHLKGNIFCSMMLGGIYFHNKNYAQAYPFLIKTSGIHKHGDNPNETTALSDRLLGMMYLDGLGVLQDYDKAMKHFNICASAGYSFCAYHISRIYASKFLQKNSTEVRLNYAKYSYAWLKITQTLYALDNDQDVSDYFKNTHISQFIFNYKKTNDTKAADELAKKICSSIPKCVQ